jgi:hypothetical protein
MKFLVFAVAVVSVALLTVSVTVSGEHVDVEDELSVSVESLVPPTLEDDSDFVGAVLLSTDKKTLDDKLDAQLTMSSLAPGFDLGQSVCRNMLSKLMADMQINACAQNALKGRRTRRLLNAAKRVLASGMLHASHFKRLAKAEKRVAHLRKSIDALNDKYSSYTMRAKAHLKALRARATRGWSGIAAKKLAQTKKQFEAWKKKMQASSSIKMKAMQAKIDALKKEKAERRKREAAARARALASKHRHFARIRKYRKARRHYRKLVRRVQKGVAAYKKYLHLARVHYRRVPKTRSKRKHAFKKYTSAHGRRTRRIWKIRYDHHLHDEKRWKKLGDHYKAAYNRTVKAVAVLRRKRDAARVAAAKLRV